MSLRHHTLIGGLVFGACWWAVGCADDDAAEATKEWYRPWYLTAEADPAQALSATEEGVEPEVIDLRGYAPERRNPYAGDPEPVVAEGFEEDGPTQERKLVTVKVRRGESVAMFSKWSGIPTDDLRRQNEMKGRRNLRIGDAFSLMLQPRAYRDFKEARTAHFTALEKDFFLRNDVLDLQPVVVKRGDNISKLAARHGNVPVWVIEKFNMNRNLTRINPGETVHVPIIEKAAPRGETAAEALFAGATGEAAPDDELPREDAAAQEAAAEGILVTVSRNETLGHYARWAGVRVSEIVAANEGLNPNVIRLGQKIRLPLSDGKLASFYRTRRRFNGTPPPAHIPGLRSAKASATAKAPVDAASKKALAAAAKKAAAKELAVKELAVKELAVKELAAKELAKKALETKQAEARVARAAADKAAKKAALEKELAKAAAKKEAAKLAKAQKAARKEAARGDGARAEKRAGSAPEVKSPKKAAPNPMESEAAPVEVAQARKKPAFGRRPAAGLDVVASRPGEEAAARVAQRAEHLAKAEAERRAVAESTAKRKAEEARKEAASQWKRHHVQSGETAWKIAVQQYKISLRALRTANPGRNLDRLAPGDVLTIPVSAATPGGGAPRRAP